ncbi:nitrate reductase molybdenum cofactor assembly chaperone [Aquicoccus sp. G2-2]|uniref:nitrate reductase molybdenum cofactor assembly chaperone n=1 Tax=Aquicoccus sp. G2-2 TaxID=3092120 RepID=UPI002AE044CA|nr:nitrate reductase molybdenum cofactor assembly chaperone [Aquicoccus sp. G2-2]MEA1112318.1 nitrate reductase molybdenum cofactor assembly chaperone [Aquicoccus sp. G2-2]
MIVTLKCLSALLTYPSADLQAATPEIAPLLRDEGLLSPEMQAALAPLLSEMENNDLFDLQERYVLLFDRSRSLSLNLFEHVHGESRERGGAMVDLLETYRAGGFEPSGPDLPDHLPMLLEFLSSRPVDEARETLADAAHIMIALAERLDRRKSSYAPVLRAAASLASVPAAAELLAEIAAQPDDDPEDLAALDAVWEEAMVTFGPDPNAGCPAGRDMLSRMPPPPKPAWPGQKP